MGFGAVGVIMLVIVFVFYMKMVDARAHGRLRKDQVQSIIEKASVFESIGKDEDALKVITDALITYPDNDQLKYKAEELRLRIGPP
jgi:hypothetical protein